MIRTLGLNYEIFIVDADGDNEKQITDRPYHADFNPSINPNGVDILFDSSPNIGWEARQIFHTTVEGSTIAQLIFFDKPVGEPQYNLVTGDILYRRKNDNNSYSNLWKASNMEFEHTVQITHSDYYKGEVALSNDGNLIVYRQYAGIEGPFSNPEIWMMNADGSDQRKIVENGSSPDFWVKKIERRINHEIIRKI